MYSVYGIPNCDTVKKVLTWLENAAIPFRFHDYKKEGIGSKKLASWIRQAGTDALLNKRSTTWKALSTDEQLSAATINGAIKIMTTYPSVIKRPVIEKEAKIIAVGFDENRYREIFGS